MTRSSRAWPLAAALLLGACAHASTVTPEQRAVQALRTANVVYEQTMIEVGRASARHTIDADQLERLRAAGHTTEAALRSAQLALGIYLTVQVRDPAKLDASVEQLGAAVGSLVDLWRDHGHTER